MIERHAITGHAGQAGHAGHREALIEFARAHACPRVPAAVVPRFLDGLSSGPAGVFDLAVDGARAVLAVVVDTCDNGDNAADLVFLGLRDARLAEPVLERLVTDALAVARAGPRSQLDLALDPFLQPHRAWLEASGFQFAYATHRMLRTRAPVLEPRTPLDSSARFMAIDHTNVGGYYEVVRAAFAEIPGASVPSRQAFCEASLAHADPRRQQLLINHGQVIGFATISVDTEASVGEVYSIGRDPAARGQGLGEHLLGQSLRMLEAAGVERVELEVAAVNMGALALYERFGFEVTDTLEILRHPAD
jgi:ribosomal protein S18 acetylase RimI-like enzyme